MLIVGYVALALVVLSLPLALSRSFRLGGLTVGLGWFLWLFIQEDRSRFWFRGAEAERWSSSELRKLRRHGWRSIDGVEFDGYDVDHVALGRGGVYAIETKRTSIPWTVDDQGVVAPTRDPLDQAARGARSIRLLLTTYGIKVDVRPALILWGQGAPDTGGGRVVRGVKVLTGRESRQWNEALPPSDIPLDIRTVDAIESALRDFVSRREEYERISSIRPRRPR
jgi:hypothetical protein